jgi:hypothetical protein
MNDFGRCNYSVIQRYVRILFYKKPEARSQKPEGRRQKPEEGPASG